MDEAGLLRDKRFMKWLAIDWGTSRLRVWRMEGESVVDKAESADGMAGLSQDGFEPALRAVAGSWLDDGPAIACGMVGARTGWVEAPYRAVPCPAASPDLISAPSSSGADVRIAAGVSQASPPDVMRGEETQIAGFLRDHPFDGVICLPGTHTKWVHVSAGEIVSFRTFMTGELFALVAERSVIAAALGAEWEDAAFDEAVAEAMSRPEALGARLFSLRADMLLTGPSTSARARASGWLIGMELAAARAYWLGQDVAVLGDGAQAAAYVRALAAQGAAPLSASAEAATLRGLVALREAACPET